jgi:hypothetical protein
VVRALLEVLFSHTPILHFRKCKQYQICCDLAQNSRKALVTVAPPSGSSSGTSIGGGPFEIVSSSLLDLRTNYAFLSQIGSWADLNSILVPVLNYLGPHIAYRPLVATKLVRLLAAFFVEKARQTDPEQQALFEQCESMDSRLKVKKLGLNF